MPKKRLPREIWFQTRIFVWERDKKRCTHCNRLVSINECNIDHIVSGKRGSNNINNLRTLCKKCHVLRADFRHRGMVANALKQGIIPPNWRELVWED